MNVLASMALLPENMSVPPNHSTTTIIHVPKNSLTGCAADCRMATFIAADRYSLFTRVNRSSIFFSATNALMMRSPPRVSSMMLSPSLHFDCA